MWKEEEIPSLVAEHSCGRACSQGIAAANSTAAYFSPFFSRLFALLCSLSLLLPPYYYFIYYLLDLLAGHCRHQGLLVPGD